VEALGEGSGKNFFEMVSSIYTVKCNFSFSCAPLPQVLHSGKMAFPDCRASLVSWTFRHSGKHTFPECISSPRATLGEDWLPQVPDFWHSWKHVTLGELSSLVVCSHASASMNHCMMRLHPSIASHQVTMGICASNGGC
jgi:hypothetical protein